MFGIQDSRSHSLRPVRGQRSGVVVSKPYDGSAETQFDTVQCGHCSLTVRHGKGVMQSFCLRCMHKICDRECCVRRGCVPKLEELDQMAAGILWEHVSEANRPIVVAVPAGVPKTKSGIVLG